MDTHISIVGDSWGYPLLGGCNDLQLYNPEDHTENNLIRLGYTVNQYAYGGISNVESIHRMQNSPPRQCDWIIWFHTEAFRDFDGQFGTVSDPFRVIDKQNQILEWTYGEFERIRSRYDANVILIGGQAYTVPRLVDRYIKNVKLHIVDWRAELLGVKRTGTHTLCHPYLFEESCVCIDDKQTLYTLIKNNTVWLDLMKKSDLFPDNCHPGGKAHKSLSMRIHKIISSTK